ncbi:MAG: tRNA preQ1(34) S-adenosylmethionine ribosyltransferase-isomerase QueA [bacterium]|jgi:S-adenosylmethionine:tRNA ribosyltransferase-isomerase|nr:tRNA preQ1(34) S-adenosylmethionine ribosyltransferase-isomerase QueA [Bacteroidales bacterium]MDD5962750.1 tRNA preQ1(34) S-adenosylmethionine ribosyltransferase-isomerase QueA [bacterium]MDD7235668.1 tRNA preQ1(34) S-adenosylmethionine ribosyltransferase-isomerase QueA [bacterium]MDY5024360.1 tRNA preQ1(34) S-adenosylmethionine ribosyltransferase-isomerase QueA [Candidatus Egerieousia sp.]
MKLSQFNFPLSMESIAKYPAKYRDESRLMVLHKESGEIEHKIFKDVIDYADEGDLFVLNDTKVFPARLHGNKEKTGADIEVFLLRELNSEQRLWDVLVDPARKIRIGNKLYFGEDDSFVAEVIDNTTSRGRTLRFLYDGPYDEFRKTLFSVGRIPVPKWIRETPEPIDLERFHTIFAKHDGAVATPAAGLHFSRELFKRMEIKGIEKAFLTLHMGLGHFRTIDVEDLSKHKMDSEQMNISEETAEMVNATHRNGKKVFAVGITVMRALETPVTTQAEIKPYSGWTNKFIFPPYNFSIADAFITNFHLPSSTMLMSAAAFGGFENVMNAYDVALKEGYKFGTYGDAMLII